jgi:hypothetical protein
MHYDRQQPGKRPSASIINRGVEALERVEKITCGPGLEMTNGPSGVVISLGTSIPGRELAITTSTITTASGTTPGSGTVAIYQPVYGGGAAVANTVTLTVYNWATNKSVPSSTNVMICKIHGVWFVDFADCA